MKLKHIMVIGLFLVAFFAMADSSSPLKLAKPEFIIGHENAMPMSAILPMMSENLQLDLMRRADLQIVSDNDQEAARLTCTIKDMKALTTVFKGSTYKAWNARISVRTNMKLKLFSEKPIEREFTIVKRLRSITGEPEVTDELCRNMAREIVNQCYEELVGIVRTIK